MKDGDQQTDLQWQKSVTGIFKETTVLPRQTDSCWTAITSSFLFLYFFSPPVAKADGLPPESGSDPGFFPLGNFILAVSR